MPAPAGAGLGILLTTPQGILLDIRRHRSRHFGLRREYYQTMVEGDGKTSI